MNNHLISFVSRAYAKCNLISVFSHNYHVSFVSSCRGEEGAKFDLIETAKLIAESAMAVYRLANQVAEQCQERKISKVGRPHMLTPLVLS